MAIDVAHQYRKDQGYRMVWVMGADEQKHPLDASHRADDWETQLISPKGESVSHYFIALNTRKECGLIVSA